MCACVAIGWKLALKAWSERSVRCFSSATVTLSSGGSQPEDQDPLASLKNFTKTLAEDIASELDSEPSTDHGSALPAFPTEIQPPIKEPAPTLAAPPVPMRPPKRGEQWSVEEKKHLFEIIQQNRDSENRRIDWVAVQRLFPHRSRSACMQMLRRLQHDSDALNSSNRRTRVPMTDEWRQQFVEIVRRLGEHSWGQVSDEMAKIIGFRRLPSDYAVLWSLHLCPKAQVAPEWTPKHTRELDRLVKIHGKDSVFLAYQFFRQYTPGMLQVMLRRLGTKDEALDPRIFSPNGIPALRQRLANAQKIGF